MLNHCALQFLLYSIKLHSSVNTANGNTVCVCVRVRAVFHADIL